MVRAVAPAIVLGPKALIARALTPALAGIALLVAPTIASLAPLLVWNISPSVPVGLYCIAYIPPNVGHLALVRLPSGIAALATRRRYLPRTAHLLKPVIAVGGDRVCRFGPHTLINGRIIALAQWTDGLGRALPIWQGCRALAAGDVFLIARDPRSFDSRYFGPLGRHNIVGRGVPVWTN